MLASLRHWKPARSDHDTRCATPATTSLGSARSDAAPAWPLAAAVGIQKPAGVGSKRSTENPLFCARAVVPTARTASAIRARPARPATLAATPRADDVRGRSEAKAGQLQGPLPQELGAADYDSVADY